MPGTSQMVNVIITEAEGPGYATIYPCDGPAPEASNLNFTTGATVANSTFVRIAANGTYCVFATQNTHVIVDSVGYTAAPVRAPAG